MIAVDVIFVNLFIIIQRFSVGSAQCGYVSLNSSEIFTGNVIYPTLLNTKSVRYAYDNLRIHFDYQNSFKEIENYDRIRKEILEPAKARLESMITVKNPSNGVLRVNWPCISDLYTFNNKNEMVCTKGCINPPVCYGIIIPNKYLNKCLEKLNNRKEPEGEGILGVDMVLLVAMKNCGRRSVLATATTCYLEDDLDRPILGMLSFCNGSIEAGRNVIASRSIVQHEIIHALGFAYDKFPFFRDSNGYPIVPRDKNNFPNVGYDKVLRSYKWTDSITKEFTRQRSSIYERYTIQLHGLTLPSVLKTAREHFKCPSIDGVDLQAYPKLSHFNEYTLYNEVMTPISNGGINSLSVFTLAIMRDTGWYGSDYNKADAYTYGKDKGCIILEGCYKYMNDQISKGQSIKPFCNKLYSYGNVYRCSDDRKYYGYCDIGYQNSLGKKYQYLRHIDGVSDSEVHLYGGNVPHGEHCPRMVAPDDSRSICTDYLSKHDEETGDILKSSYGLDNACFEHTIEGSPTNKMYGASCQKFAFSNNNKILTIYFDDKTITCPSNGRITFRTRDNYYVQFTCPIIAEFKKQMNVKDKDSNKIRTSRSFMLFFVSYYVISHCI